MCCRVACTRKYSDDDPLISEARPVRYQCQMNFIDVHPGELLGFQPIERIVTFQPPFVESPKIQARIYFSQIRIIVVKIVLSLKKEKKTRPDTRQSSRGRLGRSSNATTARSSKN